MLNLVSQKTVQRRHWFLLRYSANDNSFYVEIKCQLDATEVFIADLIACSTCFGHHYAHHQELRSTIQWLLRVVFCAVVFSSSWSGVELRVMRPVNTAQNTTRSNHCIVLLSS